VFIRKEYQIDKRENGFSENEMFQYETGFLK